MEKLTEKQAEILECIKKFIASRGYPPTVREICKIKNIASPATVQVHLNKLQDKKYISQEFLNESLYLSVPPAHPLAPFKEISFSDLNGQSVLLLSRIGFWNEVCQRMIPESHLLFQDDPSVFNELTKMSALPNFRSDITIQIEEAEDNRILIPITDNEAHVSYYAIYPKDKRNLFKSIIKQIKDIDWKKTKELSK